MHRFHYLEHSARAGIVRNLKASAMKTTAITACEMRHQRVKNPQPYPADNFGILQQAQTLMVKYPFPLALMMALMTVY